MLTRKSDIYYDGIFFWSISYYLKKKILLFTLMIMKKRHSIFNKAPNLGLSVLASECLGTANTQGLLAVQGLLKAVLWQWSFTQALILL